MNPVRKSGDNMQMIKWLIVIASFVFLVGWGKSDLQKGKDSYRAKDAAKAIESFTKAIQANPKEQEAYLFRGSTYQAIGQFTQAIEDFTKTIELNPQQSEAYWSRGYCYTNTGMDDKAIADFAVSLKLGTKMEALVYELRAGAYFRKGMFDEAEADLKKILQLKPDDPKAAQGLEQIKKARTDPGFSFNSLRSRNIAEQPQYGEGSLTAEVRKANDHFVQEIIQAWKTKERALEETLKYAWKLYKQNDYAASMRRFNEAWLLDNNNPEIFYGYSLILRAWGYVSEAEKWEQKAKEGGYQSKPQ